MGGDATVFAEGGTFAGLESFEGWWNEPGIAGWSLALVGSLALNATLLLAFLVRPGLRTISNRYVMNLTISNLLTSVVLSLLLMTDSQPPPGTADSPTSTLSNTRCALAEGTTALVTTSSVLSVFLIAVDQYFAVVDPLRYRARVDKLKTWTFIVTVWVVSGTFALMAALNPSPRSLWLVCGQSGVSNVTGERFNDYSIPIQLKETWTPDVDEDEDPLLPLEPTLRDRLLENDYSSTTNNRFAKYGLIYSMVYAVLAYLLPFAGICWIYVSIYSAAHKNSERTRRTGSRPILSTGSFCYEDQGKTYQLEPSMEEFRRIPKISSLSSIDETSETAHSIQQPRDASLCSLASEDQARSSGVIFTVGSRRVDLSFKKQTERSTETDFKVAIAAMKAEFLEKQQDDSSRYDELVRSKFNDTGSDRRRKSSHDLMCEKLLTMNVLCEQVSRDESTDSEAEDCLNDEAVSKVLKEREEVRYHPQNSRGYLSPFSKEETNSINDHLHALKESSGGAEERRDIEISRGECSMENRRQTDSNVDQEDNRSLLGPKKFISYENEELCYGSRGKSNNSPIIVNVVENLCTMDDENCTSNRDELDGEHIETELSSALPTPIVTITPPNKTGLHRTSSTKSTSSYINNLKHRISNGSLFKYREETRAARISALVIVMGLLCWLPYVALLVVKNLPMFSRVDLPHELSVTALSFEILAAYVSPLLFGYRSRRVKRELRKFFCFRRELSYKNNRSLMAKKVLKRRHSSTFSQNESDNKYNIFNCVYGRNRCPKEKVQFVQVPETALAVETCRSSFSSGASTQISSTSTDEC